MNRQDVPMPLSFSQPSLLIERSLNGAIVPQRPRDGYINATHLCRQAGKLFADYNRLGQTQDFLKALSADRGIPISTLVQIIKGGSGNGLTQGTWVHPQVAINLGQWLKPEFAVQVTKWVLDWTEGRTTPQMPVHVQRYLKNRSQIPHTHFSMLNEIYLNLVAPLEECGVILPDKMMPDISTGRMFSGFLRRNGIDPEQFPYYNHEFVDAKRRTVRARLYPIEYFADFRRYFNEVWLPDRAEKYFEDRLPKALPFLNRIQQLPDTGSEENSQREKTRIQSSK